MWRREFALAFKWMLLVAGLGVVPVVEAISAITHGDVLPHELGGLTASTGHSQKVESVTFTPGGSLEGQRPAGRGSGQDGDEGRLENLVRREPAPSAHPSGGEGGPAGEEGPRVWAGARRGAQLATDAEGPAAMALARVDPDEEAEVVDEAEACRQERARLAARLAASTSSLIMDANISAATQAAEDDPCKLLNDRMANAMPGHVIIDNAVDVNGKKLEVPTATPNPEEQTHSQAKKLAVVCSLAVAAILVTTCCVAGIYFWPKAKKSGATEAQPLAGSRNGSRAGSVAGSGKAGSEAERAPSSRGGADPDF